MYEPSLVKRMKHLLSTGEHADVYFLVGDGDGKELLSAHKLILRSASEVFEAMFRFDAKKEKAEFASVNCPVEIPDVEAAAFKVMLSFIYTEELSELNGDNAMAVLYAAKKYNISALVGPSLKIPISKLHNVFLAYAQSSLFDLEDFAHDCLMFIDKNVENLIKSEEFLQIDQNLLCEILERDELKIHDEISIWDAALRWADAKCRENGIECSAKNRRAVLGPALFKIRFPLFSKKEFLKKIVPSQVLTAEEKIGVYQFHCQPKFRGIYSQLFCPLKFPSHCRIWTFGRISMDIEEMSEFAREPKESYRYSDDTVYIKGLPCKILAQINERTEGTDNEKCLGIFLWCNVPEEDINWSCKCSAKVQIISQKNGAENSIGTFYHILNNKQQDHGFNFEFAELMEPSNGFYDQNVDKVTIAIDFAVGEPKADKPIYDSSKSFGTLFMDIEKVSEFAREVFFSERERTESTDNNEKWLGIFLLYDAPKEAKWSCKCTATVRIVSKKYGVADFKEDFGEEITLNSESVARGFPDFISFAELMDPEKGFYDQSEDKVTLAIDVTVKEAKMEDK